MSCHEGGGLGGGGYDFCNSRNRCAFKKKTVIKVQLPKKGNTPSPCSIQHLNPMGHEAK